MRLSWCPTGSIYSALFTAHPGLLGQREHQGVEEHPGERSCRGIDLGVLFQFSQSSGFCAFGWSGWSDLCWLGVFTVIYPVVVD